MTSLVDFFSNYKENTALSPHLPDLTVALNPRFQHISGSLLGFIYHVNDENYLHLQGGLLFLEKF